MFNISFVYFQYLLADHNKGAFNNAFRTLIQILQFGNRCGGEWRQPISSALKRSLKASHPKIASLTIATAKTNWGHTYPRKKNLARTDKQCDEHTDLRQKQPIGGLIVNKNKTNSSALAPAA